MTVAHTMVAASASRRLVTITLRCYATDHEDIHTMDRGGGAALNERAGTGAEHRRQLAGLAAGWQGPPVGDGHHEHGWPEGDDVHHRPERTGPAGVNHHLLGHHIAHGLR